MNVKKIVVGVVVVMAGSLLFPVAGSALPGDIDTGFGDQGYAVVTMAGDNSRARAVGVDSLDRTVIAGKCYVDEGGNTVNSSAFCIARFTPSGALDTSFSDDGFVIVDPGEAGNYDKVESLAIDALNRVIVTGKCYTNDSDFCAVRLKSNGDLDTAFGGDGEVVTDMGDANNYDSSLSVAVDSLRRVVVSGLCYADLNDGNGNLPRFCTARYTATGNLDTSFSGDGMIITDPGDVGNYDESASVAVDSLRRVIVAGKCFVDGDAHMCLNRYTASGNLDTSFNGDGHLVLDHLYETGTRGEARNVAVDSKNRIVVGGYCQTANNDQGVWCAARLTTTGNLDTSFGSDGWVELAAECNTCYNRNLHGLAIDSNDRPILSGTRYENGAMTLQVVRFSENGEFNTWFGDTGDGYVNYDQNETPYSFLYPFTDDMIDATGPYSSAAVNSYDEIVFGGRCSNGWGNADSFMCALNLDTEKMWDAAKTESFSECGTHTARARFGEAMTVGDFNGDGVEDLAVGSPGSNIAGYAGNRHGKVTIFYGPGIVRDCQVIHQGTFNGSPDSPESWDLFGGVLASGDFNDDGFDDLAVGTPYEDLGGNNQLRNAGIVEIFNGSNQGFATAPQRIHQYSPGVQSTSETGDKFGAALAVTTVNAADVLLVGVPGEGFGWGANVKDNVGAVHVFFGSQAADGIDTNQTTWFHQDTVGMPSTNEEGDEFGASLAVDPIGLIWVGAPGEDIGWGSNIKVDAGAVFLISESGYILCQSCNTALGLFGNVSFPGVSETGDRFGESLSLGTTALHMDPEIMTVAVGVPGEGLGGHPQAGMVQLMSFNSTNETVSFETLYQDRPGVNNAGEDNDRFGANVLFADLDGDTVDDLIVSVPGESIAGKANAGALAVFPIENDSWVGAASDVIFYAMQDDFGGNSIAQADFGSAMAVLEGDLIIGSPGYKIHALTDAGAIYPLDLPTASFP